MANDIPKGSDGHNERDGQNPNRSAKTNDCSESETSEGPQCPVCQNTIANRALTDTCLHEFCFECLRESSLRNDRCPHCRTQYSHIIHNIVSETQFSQTPVNDGSGSHMSLLSIVISSRLNSLRERLAEERSRLTEDMQRMRNMSTNEKSSFSRLSESEESALNTMQRSLSVVNDAIVILDDISDEVVNSFGRTGHQRVRVDANVESVLQSLVELAALQQSVSGALRHGQSVPASAQPIDIDIDDDYSPEQVSVRPNTRSTVQMSALNGSQSDANVVNANDDDYDNQEIPDEETDDQYLQELADSVVKGFDGQNEEAFDEDSGDDNASH